MWCFEPEYQYGPNSATNPRLLPPFSDEPVEQTVCSFAVLRHFQRARRTGGRPNSINYNITPLSFFLVEAETVCASTEFIFRAVVVHAPRVHHHRAGAGVARADGRVRSFQPAQLSAAA